MLLADELWPTHVALAALYVRGAPRPLEPPRRRWARIERFLRQEPSDLGALGRRLRDAGFGDEGTILASPGLLAWAEARAARFLTPVCRGYPAAWLDRLGDGAPSALWRRGPIPEGALVGIVGSRSVGRAEAGFAQEVGREAVRAGYAVVSGGAVGCDTAGARGAKGAGGAVLRLLPYGLDRSAPGDEGDLSLAAPGEPFSTALAMERNGLIYAAAAATVVVHARFRQGGTWHGATDALRRRLGEVLVRDVPEDRAHRALIALGGRRLESPSDLAAAMANPASQPSMFESLAR